MLWRLKPLAPRIAEVPIVFANREHGSSKIDGREAVAAAWIILGLGLWRRFGRLERSNTLRIGKIVRGRRDGGSWRRSDGPGAAAGSSGGAPGGAA